MTPDQFWSGRTTFSNQNWSSRTILLANIGPAGPVFGQTVFIRTIFSVTGPYAYGMSHMRILIWDAHTHMGHFVPYKYFIWMFYFFTGLYVWSKKVSIIGNSNAPVIVAHSLLISQNKHRTKWPCESKDGRYGRRKRKENRSLYHDR